VGADEDEDEDEGVDESEALPTQVDHLTRHDLFTISRGTAGSRRKSAAFARAGASTRMGRIRSMTMGMRARMRMKGMRVRMRMRKTMWGGGCGRG
jgi:hypothetical protein